jgi:LuxR family maltose regulon positive regulatory protein
VLHRARLLNRLSEALDTDATLIIAPAGYGKTTLVVDWLDATALDAAWLALNDAHRDARTLATDLARACARLHPAVEALSERVLAGQGPHAAEAILVEFTRALDQSDGLVALVLDDLDVLAGAPESLALVDGLIAGPPPGLHPVLLARQMPVLPSFPRRGALGEVTVVDAAALAFSTSEAEAYLGQADVTDPGVRTTIVERAQGWPLAVALLAASSTHSGSRGDPRATLVLDEFIRDEVMGQLAPADRTLLEACAVPAFFDGDIAAALTQRTDAPSALRALESRTQLIEALSDGPWLRMHGLLREHCLATLAREEPARLADLRERSARLLAERDEPEEATALALDAEAWALAREYIETQAEGLISRGAWGALYGWVGRLPLEVRQTAPHLALLHARMAIRLNHLPEAHALLDRIDIASLPPHERAQGMLYRAIAFRQARRLADAQREHRRARTIIEESEPEDSLLRTEADLEEGISLGMAGEIRTAVVLLESAAETAERAGSMRLTAEACQNLGLALQFADRLGAAREALRKARQRWEYLGEAELGLLTVNNDATITQALGDLAAAEQAYREIAERAEALGLPRLVALGRLGLADIARDRGDLPAAGALYDAALQIGRTIDHAGIVAAATFGGALGYRETGALAEARALLEHQLQVTEEQGTTEFASRFRTGLAGVLISEHRLAEAVTVLEAVLAGPGGGFQRRQLALLMRATAEFRLGDTVQAGRTLTELQQLVETLGYDQFLVAEARLCSDLLTSPVAASLPGGYFPRLHTRSGSTTAPETTPAPPPATPEGAPIAAEDFIVRAFGLPAVTRPGSDAPDLAWRSERSKELFLYLLNRDAPVSREDVQAALWPEAPPEKLPSLFHSTLHRLRRTVGDTAIQHDHGTYRVDPALHLDYDVATFNRHIADAARAPGDEARMRALESAVALYRGPFARTVESPWAETIRERLADRHIEARLALAKHALAESRFADAVAHAEAALATDPLNEEAVRHLIAAQVGAGHPDLALRAYRRLQDLLEREAASMPSRETLHALEQAIAESRPRT